jgi:Ulp1 family protease
VLWLRDFDKSSIDPKELDDMFRPVQTTLAVVYPRRKEIHYFDSMHGKGQFYMEGLRKWVIDEAAIKKGLTLDPSEWKLISRSHEIPQQGNGFDCGAFTSFAQTSFRTIFQLTESLTLRFKCHFSERRSDVTY